MRHASSGGVMGPPPLPDRGGRRDDLGVGPSRAQPLLRPAGSELREFIKALEGSLCINFVPFLYDDVDTFR